MKGDEDLGEDITMKGEKFHYNQKQSTLLQYDAEDEVAAAINARIAAQNPTTSMHQ